MTTLPPRSIIFCRSEAADSSMHKAFASAVVAESVASAFQSSAAVFDWIFCTKSHHILPKLK